MGYDKAKVFKQPLGRPSMYRPEYAQQLIDFFEQAPEDEYEDRDGQRVLVRAGFFPTLSRFATMCGVTQNTLRNWADAKDIDDQTPLYPEFFRAYSLAQHLQEQTLVEGYTSGRWMNPGFGALIAKNLVAWRDKSEVEQQVTATVQAQVEATIAVSGLADKLAKLKGQ